MVVAKFVVWYQATLVLLHGGCVEEIMTTFVEDFSTYFFV